LNPNPILRIDAKGCLILANAAAANFLGADIEAGEPLARYLPNLESIDFDRLVHTDQYFELETRIGEHYFQFIIKGVPKHGFANLYGSDITQRVLVEQEIQKAHRETEALLASISSILIEMDSGAQVTRWNATAEMMLGLNEA
jgi:PAS domain-containing protein